ncbi:MAG: hypothetical protein DCC71_12980 [Proteobacteria bacterium]|nr:MAG: hypothetical protein DCC71_12980 [Pseudomonadota bacterium]
MDIRWGRVVRDALGIALLVGVGGLLVANVFGTGTGNVPMPQVAASSFVLGLVGFVIAGALNRDLRGRHLWFVALGVWLLGLTSVALLGISLRQWLVSALAIFFACLFGGAIASALFRARA